MPRYIYAFSKTEEEDAAQHLICIYTEERKREIVQHLRAKYLPEYLNWEDIPEEECIQLINSTILKSSKTAAMKKLLKEQRYLTPSVFAGKIMRILNRDIDVELKKFILERNGCSRYQARQLRLISKAGMNLYDNSAEELAGILEGFTDGANRPRRKDLIHSVYKLRRIFSDEYPYLREYIEIKYPHISWEWIQEELFFAVTSQVNNSPGYDYLDQVIINDYYKNPTNVKMSYFAQHSKISYMYMKARTDKINYLIDQIIDQDYIKNDPATSSALLYT